MKRASLATTRTAVPLSGLADDDAVVIAVGDLARFEDHSTELDGVVTLAFTGLGALAGIGAECLDTDLKCTKRRRVPDGAVDDQSCPAVVDAEPRNEVADQCGV